MSEEHKSRRMPAEWEPHSACMILYPHNAASFRLDKARLEVEQVARAIAVTGKESVFLLCKDESDLATLKQKLQSDTEQYQNIYAELCPSNDTWARDTAPTFVFEGSSSVIGLDWEFNAYGGPETGAYWPCDLDQQLASKMCDILSSKNSSPVQIANMKCRSVPIILEGGSIHTDGEGTILVTKECLLNPNRNPNKTQEEIENVVLEALGASKMIWLEHGVAYDEDTNGHIDNFACFVKPGHVVMAWTDDDANDPENYQRCREELKVLESATDVQGRSLTIHKLYLPTPIRYTQEIVDSLVGKEVLPEDGTTEREAPPRIVGERMAGSYINFYIANASIVCPQFGDEAYDAKAVETLQKLFPERTVVGVYSKEILIGGGNIHCITQQVPKLVGVS